MARQGERVTYRAISRRKRVAVMETRISNITANPFTDLSARARGRIAGYGFGYDTAQDEPRTIENVVGHEIAH